ncbi:uncharacterized protein EI90DRAFT_3022989 [Cantharellus anzutake]|uniref:uncharacterized protein n=1 Tax=Cantharellus anzutake TaxID=1750568 RepID=UPI001908A82C|nr:uncharacterized protein EI90DRAFT_3022989 [Cantharellus anzutake]KAF8312549.1 hypothetical protein EI90DRAFT_3022989 [Cantharellus anzutake]
MEAKGDIDDPLAPTTHDHAQESIGLDGHSRNYRPSSLGGPLGYRSENRLPGRSNGRDLPPPIEDEIEESRGPTHTARRSLGPSTFTTPLSSSLLQPSSPYSGLKRKMSHDRSAISPLPGPQYSLAEESSSSSSNGPSHHHAFIPPMAYDGEQDHTLPPAKRRGSTFDVRISQLSLYDQRRHSVHSIHSLDSSRSSGPGGPLSISSWATRRDSTASFYSDASFGSQSTSASLFPQDSGGPNPSHSWRSPAALQPPIPDVESNHLPSIHHNRSLPTFESVAEENAAPKASPSSHQRQGIPSLPPLNLLSSQNTDQAANGGHRQLHAPPEHSERRMSVSDILISKNGRDGARFKQSNSRSPVSPLIDGHGRVSPNTSNALSRGPFHEHAAVTNINLPSNGSNGTKYGESPYSRSPELRVSHKLAERKRRKEMKELFDELRDQLPEDRTMKASKWEILTKSVEYIGQLKRAYEHSQAELVAARREIAQLTGKPYQPPNNDLLHSLPIDIINPSHFTSSSSNPPSSAEPQCASQTDTALTDDHAPLADLPPPGGSPQARGSKERGGQNVNDEEGSSGPCGALESSSSRGTTVSGERTPERGTRESRMEELVSS